MEKERNDTKVFHGLEDLMKSEVYKLDLGPPALPHRDYVIVEETLQSPVQTAGLHVSNLFVLF